MSDPSRPKVQDLEQQQAEELTPEQAEEAQGGYLYAQINGVTAPERTKVVVNHEEQY